MNLENIISILLPVGLSEYFEITDIVNTSESYFIYLEERNILPEKYNSQKLLSKGFFEPIVIQDFPLRGKPCFLQVKRRRWTIEETGEIVHRDWDVVAQGTRITKEFASFLKAINR
jgi:hypothetical protein